MFECWYAQYTTLHGDDNQFCKENSIFFLFYDVSSIDSIIYLKLYFIYLKKLAKNLDKSGKIDDMYETLSEVLESKFTYQSIALSAFLSVCRLPYQLEMYVQRSICLTYVHSVPPYWDRRDDKINNA